MIVRRAGSVKNEPPNQAGPPPHQEPFAPVPFEDSGGFRYAQSPFFLTCAKKSVEILRPVGVK